MIRLKKMLQILCVVALFLILFIGFFDVDLCMAKNSNTYFVGGIGEGNFTNIQDAIDFSTDDDTVFVYNGTFFENLVINKSINLIGFDKNTTIIDGNNNLYSILINNNWINISGFTIRFSRVGVYLSGSNTDYITVNDNIIIDTEEGFNLYNSSNNNIINNTINVHGAKGITLWNSSYNIIKNNNMWKNGWAISLSSWSNNNTVFGNNINRSSIGINLDYSLSNNIRNNNISNCERGVKLYYSRLNNITNNYIRDCYMYGIFLSNSNDNAVEPNTFLDNKQDIKIESIPPVIKAPGFHFLLVIISLIALFYIKSKEK
jgi:parallel beta-helix repeat protein